jgi:hypothetical protein
MTTEIEFLTADELHIPNAYGLTREANLGQRTQFRVLCIDRRWFIEFFVDGKETTMLWQDFLRIFHDFSVFIVDQSEGMMKQDPDEDNAE